MYRLYVCLIFVLLFLRPAAADLLWLMDSQQPVSGLFVKRNDAGAVTWLSHNDESQPMESQTFEPSEIRFLVRTLDTKRLGELDIQDLGPWRDYAEELSRMENDSLAVATAKRMLILCIYHGSKSPGNQQLVTSAARNLTAIFDSPEEKVLHRKLGQLYGGTKVTRTIEKKPEIAVQLKSNTIELLRLVRQEKFTDARIAYSSLDADQKNPFLTPSLIKRIDKAIAQSKVGGILRSEIMAAEFELRFGEPIEPPQSNPSAWEQLLTPDGNIEKWPRIEDLVEIDLEATEFRDGRWQRPEEQP